METYKEIKNRVKVKDRKSKEFEQEKKLDRDVL